MTTNPTMTNPTPTTMTTNTTMTTAKTSAQLDRLEKALRLQGIPLYQIRSSRPKYDAQQNLIGRTHYVDEDTLRCFKARILTASRSASGLLYWLVESVGSKPEDAAHNKRPVIFDVFGDTLDMPAGQEWHRTTDQAAKAAREFVASFDAEKHTRDKLKAKCKADIASARQTLAMLRPARKPAAAQTPNA